METTNAQRDVIEQILSISELAARLRVSVQTLYDLRSQGRGPRGFRVGRELRFRLSEVDSWLTRMEQADKERHRPRGSRPPGGCPRTAIGTYGAVYVMRNVDRCVAETRVRDLDGRLRKVTATANSPSAARALLKERLLVRPGYGSGGVLSLSSPFGDLVALWLADLELRELTEATKESYRDQVRLHVLPAFEHFTLGEITTGRVEWFLKSQAGLSDSRARRSRTMLNLLFRFALRHDAIARNPVEGTSPLRKPKGSPQALSLEQVAAIRAAAAAWRTDPGLPGPKPDGQVRDIIEVLLGTAMRIGEVLALRPCDIQDGPSGMIASVTGTVVHRRGHTARPISLAMSSIGLRAAFRAISRLPGDTISLLDSGGEEAVGLDPELATRVEQRVEQVLPR